MKETEHLEDCGTDRDIINMDIKYTYFLGYKLN